MNRRSWVGLVTAAAVVALAGCTSPPSGGGPTCVPAFDGQRSFSYSGPENAPGNVTLFATSPSCAGSDSDLATVVTAPTAQEALQICVDLGAGLNALDLSSSFALPDWLRPLYACL